MSVQAEPRGGGGQESFPLQGTGQAKALSVGGQVAGEKDNSGLLRPRAQGRTGTGNEVDIAEDPLTGGGGAQPRSWRGQGFRDFQPVNVSGQTDMLTALRELNAM